VLETNLRKVANYLFYRDRARGMASEARCWDSWLAEPRYVEARLSSALPAREELASAVASSKADVVEVLDVGAGPLTTVAGLRSDPRVRITAVDPLALTYDRLLRKHGITAPIPTLCCPGERLFERFGPDRFDVVTADNALDHAQSPLEIVHNMIAVCRAGGRVILFHTENEGTRELYWGLHRWNFTIVDGAFVIASLFRRQVDVNACIAPARFSVTRRDGLLICSLEKGES
jgi:SAM-dependent methyltransferase